MSDAPVTPPPGEDLYRADFAADLTIRQEPEERPTLVGHFARFNEWTEINSAFEGHFLERISPGAFTKTFRENAQNLRVLFQHGKDILGQQVLGKISVLREEDAGAYYEVPLFDGVPPLILEGLRAGEYGSSFRFSIVKEEFDPKPAKSDHNPKGLAERTVTEARVREFGPVTFPAYAGATAGIRSLTDEFMVGRLLQDPDRLRELLEATTAQEPQHSKDVKPEPSEATTSPDRSRSTQRDYLRNGEEERPAWLL